MINGKKIVALCTYRVYDTQEFSLFSELVKKLKAHNCYLFIYALNSEIGINFDTSPETEVFDLIPYDKVDVVVVMNERLKVRRVCQDIIDRAGKANVPVLVIDGDYDNVSTVRFDYAKGFEQVVRHIIEDHKVKRPHFMAGHINNQFSNERIEIFKKVIEDNNISFDKDMVSYGEFWALPCRTATYELLKRDTLPDAIICANDIMAINVCDVLNEAGIKVPEDIIVSGFDGIDEAFLSTPGITTSICRNSELAGAVVEVLLDIFDGRYNETKWVLPTFVPNESCGCPRKEMHVKATVSELNNLFYHHEDESRMYHSIISKFMLGKDIEHNIRYLKENHAKYAIAVVEKSCFGLEENYFYDDVERGEQIVVFDPYVESADPYPYDKNSIVPHLEKLMESADSLIFNCLVYMDKSFGFVCFSYPRTMLIDYNQTPNITNCIEMSVGGYALTRHQMYLRDKMKEMYQNDELTGLYNRLAYLSKMTETFTNNNMNGKTITVIMQDLDGLKEINDNLGHMAGDAAIKAVATALKESCPSDSICVRAGGDEMFALIFCECDAEEIIAEINRRLEVSSKELGFKVSASMGTSSVKYDGGRDVIGKAIGLADERMYENKRKMKQDKKLVSKRTD